MKCRHLYESRMQYRDVGIHTLWFRPCERCGAWLSLGPSSDDSEPVRIEMRAAELAAEWDPNDGRWDGFVSLGMCSPMAEHVDILERDIASGRDRRVDLANYIVGHLACCIASHSTETVQPASPRSTFGIGGCGCSNGCKAWECDK